MDPTFSLLNGDRDKVGLAGDMDLLSTLGKNPESLINGSEMNPAFQCEMDDFLKSVLSNDEPEQKGHNLTCEPTSRHKDILAENAKLKMFINKLKLKNIEQESQLADYESRLAEKWKTLSTTEKELEIVKEKFQANETENENLNAYVGQLRGLLHQYKHLTLQNDHAYKNYSALETKMKRVQGTVKKLRSKLAKYKEEGADQNESSKLKDHIKRLWKLIALGSEKSGLTVKEKKKLTNEYKKWFPSEDIFLQFKGKKKDMVNILHDLPSNLMEVLTTPENFSEMPSSIDIQDTSEETMLTFPDYSVPALPSSDYKVSSSDDSPIKTVQHIQSVPERKSETTCNKKIKALNVSSYPCSPDSLSHQVDTNTYSTESPAVSLDQQKSLAGRVLNVESSLTEQLIDISDLSCSSLLESQINEAQNTCGQIQESLEQSSYSIVNTKPPTDVQDSLSLCNIAPHSETKEYFSGEISNEEELNEALPIPNNEADHVKDLPQEVKSLEKMSVTECELSESSMEDFAFSDNSVDAPDVLIELNQQIPFESALFMKNEADLRSRSANNNFETSLKQFLPIFSVPKLISPLPITPPNTNEKKESKKGVENSTEVSSNKAMKKIEFRFLSDNLTLKQNNSLSDSPKHLVCKPSQNYNEQSCVPIHTDYTNSEDLEHKKTHVENSAISSKTSLKLISNQMSPDNWKNSSHLESAKVNNSKCAVELLHDLENDCQEVSFTDTLQKKINPTKSPENESVTLIPEPSIKISQRNKLDVIEQNDSVLQDISHQQKLACANSSKNIQSSNAENFHSEKKQGTILSAEIFNSIPLRVRGRTFLNKAVLKKRKIESVANGEVKEQTELEGDQALRTKSANVDESLTLSDYIVVCKPKKKRLEHKKKITSLSTSNSNNVTVNTDKTTNINRTDDNCKKPIKSAENKGVILIPGSPMKKFQRNKLDLVERKDSESQVTSQQRTVSCTSFSKNIQTPNLENVQSKKKQRTVLNADISNSVPVRVRGRTLLNRGIFKKPDEVTEQTELEGEQALRTKSTNADESLTLSDYTVMCKPKKVRLEHKKNIVSLSTSNSNNVTVNTLETVLILSSVNVADDNSKKPIKSAGNNGETEANDEVKKQTEPKDQALRTKSAIIDEESLTQSNYAVVGNSEEMRMKHKKNINNLSKSISDNSTMNIDKTVLVASGVKDADNTSNKNGAEASAKIEAFKERHTNAVSHMKIKNKASEVIALLNLFPIKTNEVVLTDPTSFIETEESVSCNKVVPTCVEDLITMSLGNKHPKYDAISLSEPQSSSSTTKNLDGKEECLVSTLKTKDLSIEKREISISSDNNLNARVHKSNCVNYPWISKIDQNSLGSVGNISVSSKDGGTSGQHLIPSIISKGTKYTPHIRNCVKKIKNATYARRNRSSNCKKTFVSNINKKLESKLSKCDKNKLLAKDLNKNNSLLNRECSGLETQSCTKKNKFMRSMLAGKMKRALIKKRKCEAHESLLEKFFQENQSYKKCNYVQSLVEFLTNQDSIPNSTALLFHVLNYLVNSKKNPLHTFSLNEDSSVLLPLDEDCIVTALYTIESKKEPPLDGLLRTAMTTISHLILAKKFNILGLASLCRVFTEICKREKDSIKPVILCSDLLKMKHCYATFLIACVAGVWKELFQIEDNLPVEEKLFHSSILYGACKRPKKLTEFNWKNSVFIISKYFTAPPVNDARSAIQILKNFIEIKCQNDSWNNQYMTSALIILAVYEDWDWIKNNLLDNYIVPNLTQFGCKTLNRVAFDLYCNLYVDIWFLKIGDFSYENYLSDIFNNSEMWKGATFVSECVALALIKLIYMKNKLIPPFLASWFENNHQRPIVQTIEPVFIRKLMRESESELLLQDIQ